MQGGLDAAIAEHTVLQAALCCGAGLQIIEIGHDNAVGFHLAGGVLEDGAAVNRRDFLADTLGGSIQTCQFPLTPDTAHVVAAVVVGGSAPEVGPGDLLDHLLAGIAVGSQAAIQIGEQNIEIFTMDTDVVGAVHDGKRCDLLAGNGTNYSDHTLSKGDFMTLSLPS